MPWGTIVFSIINGGVCWYALNKFEEALKARDKQYILQLLGEALLELHAEEVKGDESERGS